VKAGGVAKVQDEMDFEVDAFSVRDRALRRGGAPTPAH
jgi:hypothetical protein